MRRALNLMIAILSISLLCSSLVCAAAVTSPEAGSLTRSSVNTAGTKGETVKITVPTDVGGLMLNPGIANVFKTPDGLQIKDKFAYITLGGKDYPIGPSSQVKKTPEGDITGKTSDEFMLGRFKPGQIPAGITFKFSPPDKMAFGKDSEGKVFNNPSTGKFLPTFIGGKQELQITSLESGVKVKTDGTLTLLNVPGKPVTMSSDGTSEVSFKNDKGNTVLSGKGFQIGPKERVGQAGPLTFNQDGEVTITSTGQVIAKKGDPEIADGKAIVKTPPSDPKELSSKPDGSTAVRSKKTEQGTTDFLSIITDAAKSKAKELGKEAVSALISTIGPGGLTGTVTDKPSTTDGKPKPGEAAINPKTGDVALNPGEAQISLRSSKGLVAATGEGDLRFNLNEINDKKLNLGIGDLKLEDGEFKGPRLPEIDLTALIGSEGKPAAKVGKGAAAKSANPAVTPPAPAAAQAPAESNTELDSWYNKNRDTRVSSFMRALDNLGDTKKAEQWKSAIENRDYTQIKKIQEAIGTSIDGKLGGGSLRALNSYAEYMNSQVTTEDDQYEPTPVSKPTTKATTPKTVTPAKPATTKRPAEAAQPAEDSSAGIGRSSFDSTPRLTEQSKIDSLIEASRARKEKLYKSLSSETIKAAETSGLPLSEMSARLKSSTTTSQTRPAKSESAESLRFQTTVTAEQRTWLKSSLSAQIAEQARLTPSTIHPAVARLPQVKASDVPPGTKAGDVMIQRPGNVVYWMAYNQNTRQYTHPSGDTYSPFQVARMTGSRVIR